MRGAAHLRELGLHYGAVMARQHPRQGNKSGDSYQHSHQVQSLDMRRQSLLARRLKIDIWFCDPHAPRQRGSNENTNGLLRQFFPKGTDLGDLSQTTLNDVARMMNDRPRKTLVFAT